MKKQYKITILALLLSVSLYGQIDRFNFTINGGESYAILKNNFPDGISKEKFGYTGNVQFNAAISHSFGIGIGAGYSKYSSYVSIDDYYSATNAIDSEGDHYEYRLNGTNLKENQSIDIIEIPIVIIFQNQKHKKFKTNLQLGAKALLPIQSNFECTAGALYSRGYYSQYNV